MNRSIFRKSLIETIKAQKYIIPCTVVLFAADYIIFYDILSAKRPVTDFYILAPLCYIFGFVLLLSLTYSDNKDDALRYGEPDVRVKKYVKQTERKRDE